MRRSYALVFLLVLCLAASIGSAYAATVNFVANPGFEDGTGSAAPTWYAAGSWGGGTGQAVLGTTTDPAHGGVRMWKQNADASAATGTQVVVQEVYMIPGGSYTASVWVRVPSATPTTPQDVRLRLWFGRADNLYVTGFWGPIVTITNSDWTLIQGADAGAAVTPDPTCDRLQFRVWSVNAGQKEIYVDDAALMGTAYVVSGQVLKSDGGPAAGATVSLQKAGVTQGTRTLDATGNYSFQAGPGDYTILASLTNYEDGTATVPTVVDSDQTAPTITLTKLPTAVISGQVYQMVGATKTGVAGAVVSATNGVVTATAPVTTSNGNYSFEVAQNQEWTISVMPPYGYRVISVPAAVTPTSSAPITGQDIKLATRVVPQSDQILFAAVADSLPSSGATGPWPCYLPNGESLTVIGGAPAAELVNGVKWEKNSGATSDGFRFGARVADPIEVNGATIVVAVKPVLNATNQPWTSVVDIFYDRLRLGVRNDTGVICAGRNINTSNVTDNSTYAIPDGQITILSMVVQPDGSYKVYANGSPVMDLPTSGVAMTQINPNHMDTWSSDPDFTHYINVGRNQPDGWTAYNGYIGDVYVYKVALSESDRVALENAIADQVGILKTISGRVIDTSGVPVEGATVRLVQGSTVLATGISAAGGAYAFQAPIAAGAYQLTAVKANYSDAAPIDLTVVDGTATYTVADLVIDPFLYLSKISGIVTDAITGQPAPGVKLTIASQSLTQPYALTTAADGSYSIDVVQGVDYTIDIEAGQTPLVKMQTALADRYMEVLSADWTANLSVIFPSTISGKATTTDGSSAAGFAVVVTNAAGAVVGTSTTAASGTFSFTVDPGQTYTVSAYKTGYVTGPGPQAVNVALGKTAYTVADFVATASSIKGILKDAVTGKPIYNGVVQSGTGANSAAVVTGVDGEFTLPGTGVGGVELFGDALGYHCKNYVVTGNGDLYKIIELTPEAETGVIINGGFENVVNNIPTDWTEKWGTGGLQYNASTDAASGSYSCWYTGTASYDALAQYVATEPGYVYTAYFKAKADATVAQWFPMISFRGDYTDPATGEVSTDVEMKGWISGEPGKDGWVHTPPYEWYQYLLWHTYSGDSTRPFVRVAAPAGATNIAVSFCFADLPAAGLGCYVDDVVIDKVAANEPLVTVAPDTAPVAKAFGANNKSVLTDDKLVGKTVRVWGSVVSVDGTTSFVISDGYSAGVTVNTNGVALPAGFGVGEMAVVTGVVNADKSVKASAIAVF